MTYLSDRIYIVGGGPLHRGLHLRESKLEPAVWPLGSFWIWI
jgi:hypothetical protein